MCSSCRPTTWPCGACVVPPTILPRKTFTWLTIIEGRLEAIRWDEKTPGEQSEILTAFPFLIGEVVDLRAIEQGVDQLNHLPSNHITTQLIPGSEKGKTIVVLQNQREKTLRANINYDNSGQKSTGERMGMVQVEKDNLLHLNDKFRFIQGRDLDGVIQFTDIARPGMADQLVRRPWGEACLGATGPTTGVEQKDPGQWKDVVPTFAEREKLELDHLDAVAEIRAEVTGSDLDLRVLPRGDDQSRVDAARLRPHARQ